MTQNKLLPIAGFIFAATLWGIIWYPYRLLHNAGVGGEMATLATYLSALIATGAVFPRAWRQFGRAPLVLSIVALAAGCCNLAYVLGILTGEVMRVLLLFYLAPLWTILLARLILKETLTPAGYSVVFLALCGAIFMLWNPSLGLPVPSGKAEWLGLVSGFSFALSNVMVRRAGGCGTAIKTISVFSGVVLVSLITILLTNKEAAVAEIAIIYSEAPLIVLVGIMLVTMSLAVNYGLSQVPATRAIVVMLFELVVAALASYVLADEVMGLKEWIGGVMIVAASLFSGQIKEKKPESAQIAVLG